MAITETTGKSHISIVFDASTHWDSSVNYPNGLSIKSLETIPGAISDTITVRDTSATGVQLTKKTAANAYDNHVKLFSQASDQRYHLYVVKTEVTSGVMLIIELG